MKILNFGVRSLSAFALCATMPLGCSTNVCEDGLDNDEDGLIDSLDPGCAFNGDAEFPEPAACNDGVDNDSDGIIDSADPGCDSTDDNDEFNDPIAQCRDGIDNDGDGLIDFPNDPGCELSLEDDEADDCPDGPECPECSNGVDDDGDGATDYPSDPGCDNAGDEVEFNADPTICGASVPLNALPADGIVIGSFSGTGSNNLISIDCGGSGEEIAYQFTLNESATIEVTTDFPETSVDTVLYLRSDCRGSETELQCNDDFSETNSRLYIESVPAGTYYLVVDSHNAGTVGDFKLQMFGYAPQGGPCDDTNPLSCPPSLVCRSVDGSAPTTCEAPECRDGTDNDNDGNTDYPDEPGCSDPEDNDETDDCDGAKTNCPECSDGVDNDSDGNTDYGADVACLAAGDDDERECELDSDPVLNIDQAVITGSTSGLTDDFAPSCSSNSAPDRVFTFIAPAGLDSITFDTEGSAFDTVLAVYYEGCGSADELDCDDDGGDGNNSRVALSNPAAGMYLVMVDGFSSSSGAFQLNIDALWLSGSACDPAATVARCEDGYACGTVSNTCDPAACSDGTDNDSDGATDYPDDAGCTSANDGAEADCNTATKVGNCPACNDGIDNDSDGFTDELDIGCQSPSDDDELDQCVPGVDLQVLTQAGATGTTPSSGDFINASCDSLSYAEHVYVFELPEAVQTLTFDMGTSGSNILASVRLDDCSSLAAEISCQSSDSTPIALNTPAAGTYFLHVEGGSTDSASYVIEMSATLAVGGICDTAFPNFACPLGTTCSGSPGTCDP